MITVMKKHTIFGMRIRIVSFPNSILILYIFVFLKLFSKLENKFFLFLKIFLRNYLSQVQSRCDLICILLKMRYLQYDI